MEERVGKDEKQLEKKNSTCKSGKGLIDPDHVPGLWTMSDQEGKWLKTPEKHPDQAQIGSWPDQAMGKSSTVAWRLIVGLQGDKYWLKYEI